MSGFSNTDTGSKAADPYTEVNKQTNISAQDKIEALDRFVNACKFGMMTTRDQSSGKLVSRCMAVAAKVKPRHITPCNKTNKQTNKN